MVGFEVEKVCRNKAIFTPEQGGKVVGILPEILITYNFYL
jgi:hypothetical protein